MEFALRQMYGCPVDRKHFSHFTKSAANAAKYRTARTIAHGVADATAICLQVEMRRRSGERCVLLRKPARQRLPQTKI
jgi:hypothetical protein